MASATLNLKVTPRRMVSDREAAEYCGRSLAKFRAACPVAPVEFPDGARLFDLRDLDVWLDGLKGASLSASADDILAKLG
jgi:hypothetical protein